MNKTTTNKTKQKKRTIVSLLLIGAILIGGAFAFLTAQDSKTNVFTVGNVKVKLSERFDTNLDGEIQDPDEIYDSSDVTEVRIDRDKSILPGQKIIKSPYVENTGKNEAWTYVVVGIPTTNSDAVFRDDSGNTAIAGQDVSIKITAYAIQDKYKDKTTSEDVWNAYFSGKEVSTFGTLETSAENLSARVPLFTVLNDSDFDSTESIVDNSCNSEWTMLTHNIDGKKAQVYRSSDGYDYYIFGYNTKLAAPADGEDSVKTTPVFKGVKLQKDIGEARPVTLNYYKAEQTGNTGAGETDLSVTNSIPEGYTLVETEYYMPGSKVATLYYDDTLAKTGYSFDWRFAQNKEKSAYCGMVINEDTNLIADYVNRVEPEYPGTKEYFGNDWLVYTIGWDKESSSLYAELNGADYGHVNYPIGSIDEITIVPANITLNRSSENIFKIADGTFKQATEEAKKHISLNTNYTIPVKKIVGNSTLTESTALSSVTKSLIIGDNVNYIGVLFSNSSSLQTVSLPYAASKTESSFKGCVNIKEIVFPNKFQSIGNDMFNGCTSLSQITFSESITSIGNGAFAQCPIVELQIPNNCKTIGQVAFSNCKQLQKIILSDSVESFGYRAFDYCSEVKEFIMGKNLKTIGFRALYGWKNPIIKFNGTLADYCLINYTDVNQGVGVKDSCPSYYASELYIDGKIVEGDLVIPEGVTSISAYSFYNCNNLTSIYLPKTLKTIQFGAFEFAAKNKLDKISINSDWEAANYYNYPSSNIDYIFKNVWVNQLHIGADVTNIKSLSPIYQGVKKSYHVNSKNHNFSAEDELLYNYNKTQLIGVPLEKSGEIIIPDSVQSAYEDPFSNRNKITSISFGEQFEKIPDRYFEGCTALQSVKLGKNINSISSTAFVGNYEKKYRPYNLNQLTISEDNPYYYSYDNVIYTKKGELVAYPCGKTEFIVPDKVTSIPESFFSCTNVQKVVFSDSVTTIPAYAFAHSTLKDITISSSIKEIGESAFKNCALNSVNYTGTLAEWSNIIFKNSDANPNINNKAFYVQNNLVTELDLTGCIKISDHAFIGLKGLTKIVIPGSVKSIGYGAFRQCNNVTTVEIQDGVESIGDYAFQPCASLENVSIAGTVNKIGMCAFKSCQKLKNVTLQNGIKEIGYYAFCDCKSLTEIKLPESITTMYDGCFQSCSLTSVNIPKNLTVIPALCFRNCNLTEISIPEGISTIQNGAFAYTDITSLTIPNSVTSIYSPDAAGGAFEGCSKLKEISIGTGLTVLNGAFSKCTALESVTIPSNINKISGSFSGCTSLKNVQLNEGLSTLGYGAFSGCTNLEEIVLPKSLESFEIRAFNNCTNLKKVTINGGPEYGLVNGLYSENDKVFSNCPNIQEVIFGDNVTTVYDWFKNKQNLSKITITNATTIGADAFSGCTNLSEVVLPETLKEIQKNAFANCTGLTKIDLPNSIDTIGNYAFNKTALSSVVLPNNDNLTVKQQAFGDADLHQVTIPNVKCNIEDYAFSNNLNLQTIDFKGTKAEWNKIQGDRTFVMLGLHSGCSILCSDGSINFS